MEDEAEVKKRVILEENIKMDEGKCDSRQGRSKEKTSIGGKRKDG